VTLFYTDASTLVKLVREEPESEVLRTFVEGADLISSDLVLTEVPRVIRRAAATDPELPLGPLIDLTAELLAAIALLPLDRALLSVAGALAEPVLRTLDAIHIAAAVDVSPIHAFVSYDERQSAAARLAGLRTAAPGAG
jgi:uncharacterized protein